MKRKTKVQLVTFFYIPIVFSLCILITYLFPYKLEKILRLSSYIFAIGCLIVPWLPWSKYRIHSLDSIPHTYSFFRWYITIVAIEIGLVSLFFILNYSQLLPLSVGRSHLISISNLLTINWLSWSGLNLALFPWTTVAILGAFFAYFSIKYRTTLPWSAYIAPQHISFFWNELRRIFDTNILICSRLFIVLNIVFITLWLSSLIYPTGWDPYNLFYSIFVVGFLLVILHSKLFQKILNWLEKRGVRQGLQLGIIFLSVLAITILGSFMIGKVKPQLNSPLLLSLLSPLPITLHPNFIYMSLLRFCFWTLAIPLASSWLVNISKGRTIRQFFIGVLSFPLIVVSLIWFVITKGWVIPFPSFNFPFSMYLITFIGLITFGFIVFHRNITTLLWLGYFPCYPIEKEHRAPLEQLWMFTICILALAIAFSTQGVVLSIMTFVLPTWIVFLFTLFNGLFPRLSGRT